MIGCGGADVNTAKQRGGSVGAVTRNSESKQWVGQGACCDTWGRKNKDMIDMQLLLSHTEAAYQLASLPASQPSWPAKQVFQSSRVQSHC
jgi:hypothetical protein